MTERPKPKGSHISLVAAVSIGVGVMIGAGIFSIIGVVAGVSGSALPIVFIIGAIITIFSVYSYSKLSVRYPSVGGAVEFLLPKEMFMEKLWNKNIEGLFISAGLVILLLLVFDLAPISMMASGAVVSFVASFVLEWVYRRVTGRTFQSILSK